MSRFANMTPEERRAAFEAMSPEEREAMRERRRAMREQQGEGADASGNAPRADRAAEPRAQARSEPRTDRAAGDARPRRASPAASAPEGSASAPVRRATSGGFTGGTAQRAPRSGTVKVIDAAGKIEERKVELGVVTRVQAQVLSGLKEGDEVVVGIKPPPAAQQRAPGQGGAQQGPGGAPGGGRGR